MATSVAKKPKLKKGAGQLARTVRSLVAITSLGVVLAVYNAISLRRDVSVAIGPEGKAQELFFVGAAERPDISTFFKHLTPSQRLAMSKNVGRYTDPELAKLCGKCLETFDPAARAALTESLALVAKAHPSAAAALLSLPGSFQQIAISTSLRRTGDAALPLVAKQFSNGDARPNAIAFLVATGAAAIGPTLPYLDDANKDVRLAAADTLGKLHARKAVARLTAKFSASQNDEQLAYLTALASIGEPSSEGLMRQTLLDATLSTPHRAQAALGLGAIASREALATLWKYSNEPDKSLSASAITGLRLAGDPALHLATSGQIALSRPAILSVAAGIHSPFSDSLVRSALIEPKSLVIAASAAGNRPTLVPDLTKAVLRLNSDTEGDQIDTILKALSTTTEGRAQFKLLENQTQNPSLIALCNRRSSLRR